MINDTLDGTFYKVLLSLLPGIVGLSPAELQPRRSRRTARGWILRMGLPRRLPWRGSIWYWLAGRVLSRASLAAAQHTRHGEALWKPVQILPGELLQRDVFVQPGVEVLQRALDELLRHAFRGALGHAHAFPGRGGEHGAQGGLQLRAHGLRGDLPGPGTRAGDL